MLNILVPLSGGESFKVSEEHKYPKILTDIDGQLLIERAAKPFLSLEREFKITIALPQPEAEKYQLQNVMRLLGKNVETCSINGSTQGAVCSALLATEELTFDAPLIVTSFEQVLDMDINEHIDSFINEGVDAGVLTFEAMHPKWSYVKTDSENLVTQSAEKMPISNKAIAGLYYFKSVNLFIESAKAMIRKDVKTNGCFYISPTLNEVILNEGKVKSIDIDKANYFHLSDDYDLTNYEKKVVSHSNKTKSTLLSQTKAYAETFNLKNIEALAEFFDNSSVLIDPEGEFVGKSAIYNYVQGIFNEAKSLEFISKNTYVAGEYISIIEFELRINDLRLVGTDVIEWNPQFTIKEIRAYLHEVQ